MKAIDNHIGNYGHVCHSFGLRLLTTFALMFVMVGLAQETVTHITSCPYSIISPGLYQLDVDCTVGPDATAIGIQANDVDLNLNGHTISGPISAANDCGVQQPSFGIYVTGSNVHIHNGTVTGCKVGILFDNCHDNEANGLTATGNCNGILMFIGSHNNHINGNNVSGNFEIGVRFQNSNDNECDSNAANNTGALAGGAGFFLANSDGNVIASNDISDNLNNPGVRLINSHSNTIRGNTANGNSGSWGIRIDGDWSSGNVIKGNTALHNGQDLADFNPAPPCKNTWKRNTFDTDSEGDGPGHGCIK